MKIELQPVATVRNSRTEATDDYWGEIISEIELAPHIPDEALAGIEGFSHLEIIYFFDRAADRDVVYSGHPRGNMAWPLTGIFAQRKKDRPNHLGLCTVELIEHTGRSIRVRYLDAINGTPVLDIKPVMQEFRPVGSTRQPAWVSELMRNYWK